MARRRRVKRRKGGRKARLFSARRLLVAALLILPLLYFAFTRLFFDPFEEPHASFDRLVPREVELYARREALASDFREWPILRLQEALRVSQPWKEFAESDMWQRQQWPAELQASLEELDAALADAPFDLLDDVLGREVVVVAKQVESPDAYALMARISNAAKFAVSGAEVFDDMLSDQVPGLTVEPRSDPERPGSSYLRVGLEGGDELFTARDRDLLVIARDEAFLREILAVVHGGAARSLAVERLYSEYLPAPSGVPEERFSASFVVEFGELVRVFELRPNLLDPQRDVLDDLWPRVFDPAMLRRGLGRLELQPEHLGLQIHADVETEIARALTGGLAGEPDFPTATRLGDMLRLMPWDVGALLTANVRLKDLLQTFLQHVDADTRRIIDERIRRVASLQPGGALRSLPTLIDELARAFGDELTIAVRQPDHEQEPGSQPLPLLAFLMPVQSVAAWEGVESGLLIGASEIGFDTGNMFQLDMGSGMLKWLGVVGLPFEEFAYIVVDQELAIFSTDRRFAEEIVKAYLRAPDQRVLGAERDVARLLDRYRPGAYGASRANLAVWFDMQALWELVEPYATYVADLESVLDHATLRARERARLLQAEYPQFARRAEALPEEVEADLAERLDAYIDEQERLRREETIPKAAAAWRAGWAWRALLGQGTAGLRLGERDMDLQLHLETALQR